MRFIKYHGLGNDFIILRDGHGPPSAVGARALCARGEGVGADGVMRVSPSSVAAVRMDLVNSDGSTPEMCGNGIRALVKYAVEELGLDPAGPIPVETGAGIRRCFATTDSTGHVTHVRVDMGAPSFERASVPVRGDGLALDVEVRALGERFTATGVHTGNPHMVIFGDASVDSAKRYGPILTHDPQWPAGANVEFAAVRTPTRIDVAVWERGCGLTRACGTGATAVAAAAVQAGLSPAGEPITVALPGGVLTITVEEGFHTAWMEGPVTEVYRAILSPALVALLEHP